VYDVAITLFYLEDKLGSKELHTPLHSFGMIYLWLAPYPFLPDAHRSIPTATHELGTCRAPIARHDCGHVSLVYLSWRGEGTDVECI